MAGNELQRDTRLLPAVLASAPHGVALCDGRGRIERWNDAAAQLLGTTAEEATGRDLAWLHGHDETAWPADAAARAAEGETVVWEGWRRRADGTRFWCQARLHGLHDEDGRPCGLSEGFADATAARSAEQALRDADALFATALRSAPVGLATQDLELRYSWAPSTADALGASAEGSIVGREDTEIYPPQTAETLARLKREVLSSGSRVRSEVAVERDGATRWFDLTLEPLRDHDGALTGVMTVAFEVTDRTLVEQEVERSRARLAEAERVARLGSWEWDIAANRVTWSDGLFEIYGITREEFDPAYQPSADRVHPDDRARLDAAVRSAVETCEPIDLEYRILRPDGRVRRVHGRAEVIVDAAGKPVRLAGTAQDITDVRVSAEALAGAAAELERRATELRNAARAEPAAAAELERSLTRRQLEILALVAEGLSNAEIAHRLFLSEDTVKWHMRKILRGLGVSNRAQAVARYLAAR
jgi:PAS domain S-box-containing protein